MSTISNPSLCPPLDTFVHPWTLSPRRQSQPNSSPQLSEKKIPLHMMTAHKLRGSNCQDKNYIKTSEIYDFCCALLLRDQTKLFNALQCCSLKTLSPSKKGGTSLSQPQHAGTNFGDQLKKHPNTNRVTI